MTTTLKNERLYSVLLAPVVTEKSTRASAANTVTFRVAAAATKADIKAAVETLYKVQVENVNTVNIRGKSKVFRGKPGQRSAVRKAYVRLAEGQTIDLSTSVQG